LVQLQPGRQVRRWPGQSPLLILLLQPIRLDSAVANLWLDRGTQAAKQKCRALKGPGEPKHPSFLPPSQNWGWAASLEKVLEKPFGSQIHRYPVGPP
jgi:hypothetical protein